MKEKQPTIVEMAQTFTRRHWAILQGLIEGKTITQIAKELESGVNVCSSLKSDIAERMVGGHNITPGINKAIVVGIALGKLDASGLTASPKPLPDSEIEFLHLNYRGAKQEDIMRVMRIKKNQVSSMRTAVPKHIGLDTIYSAVAWIAEQERIAGRLEPEDLKKIFSLETQEAVGN